MFKKKKKISQIERHKGKKKHSEKRNKILIERVQRITHYVTYVRLHITLDYYGVEKQE